VTHPIPDEALDSDIAIIARKGSGKSYLARGLAERLLDLKRRLLIIDPLGSWWGLKSSADGQRAGYPVAVFGGDHADMPLNASMGEPLAKLISNENLPCVIDTSLMRKEEQGELAIDLFEGLFRFNKDALTIILEEADVFAPQNPAKDGYAARVLHEVDRIARRGRARGLRLISLTQRPARLHKDVLSQAAALVAMRLTSPHDRAAIEDWIKGNADAAQSREVMDSLATLPVGSGWIWAPDLDLLTKAKFPKIKTLDTSATPKAGETRVEPKTLAEVDVAALREALKPVLPAEKAKPAGEGFSLKDIDAAEQRGFERGYERGKADEWARGESAVRAEVVRIQSGAEAVAKDVSAIARDLKALGQAIEEISKGKPSPAPAATTDASREVARQVTKHLAGPAKPAAANGSGENKLLAAIAAYPPVTWDAAAIRAGYAPSGGGFRRARKTLIEAGTIIEDGDGELYLARAPAGPRPDAPSRDQLLDLWASKMGVAGKLLRTIADTTAAGKPISIPDLAGANEYAPTGGGFRRAMKSLRSSGAVVQEGKGYRLSDAFVMAAGGGR